jgi:ribose transport system ATP-binding protein
MSHGAGTSGRGPAPEANPAICGTSLEATGVSKAFPGTQALVDAELEVRRGEIHALVGGNGSGKSTMVKILAGVYRADRGSVSIDGGEPLDAGDITPALSHSVGIRVVHQDLGIFPEMTVAENIALGAGFDTDRLRRIRWRAFRRRAAALIERFEIEARPDQAMEDISVANQTLVAIARALQDQKGPRGLLILDEPTAALPAHEVELLFDSLRRFAAAGQSILYISHRLDEILGLCSRVSVLRDGRSEGTYPTRELSESDLTRLILGRELQTSSSALSRSSGERLLRIEGLTGGPLRGVDLEVRRGEVVGIAGLLGSGRSTLLHTVFGERPRESGTIEFAGEPVEFSHPREAMAAGIALVPANRGAEAAFFDKSIGFNVAAASLSRYWRRMLLRDRWIRKDAERLIERYAVRAPGPAATMETLSGGNQQKVVVARWMHRVPRLLLLDEPTQGVDVGARADIYGFVRDVVGKGVGVLLVASDLEELGLVCDRVLVLRGGRLVAGARKPQLSADHLTELLYSQEETRCH